MKLVESQVRQIAASRTIADRVIGWLSPAQGLARLQSRVMLAAATGQGGYEGGRRERRGLKFWRPPEGSANADLLPDLPDLRARTRDLARNVPIATGAIATNVTSVVGVGLQLQAAVDTTVLGLSDEAAALMKAENEREWAIFCKSADLSRVQGFDDLQALVYRAQLESGDVFVVRRYRLDAGDAYGTKLQVIESDRVSNPDRGADTATRVAGIEVDKDGVPVAFHISDKHPGGLRVGALTWNKIAARTREGLPVVLHLFGRLRPEQSRGIPYLAPVIELLKQLGDVTAAEARAAVLTSFITWFIKTALPEDDNATPVIGTKDAGLADDEIKLGTGAVVSLGTGESVEAPAPSRPNPQLDPFILSITRQIGVALEVPQELLIKHFTASYTASRAAVELAYQYFSMRRAGSPRLLCQTAYEWMMEEAVAAGRLNRPGFFDDPLVRAAYCGARWIGAPRISLDALKDANADRQNLENGTVTREEICLERTGGDWATKHKQLARETTARAADGMNAAIGHNGGPPLDDEADDDDDDTENETQPKRGKAS